MTEQSAIRLLKLAKHLKYGKLGHEQFNFTTYNTFGIYAAYPIQKNKCGTHGCAIGECPVAFPDEWIWDDGGLPKLKEFQGKLVRFCGITFFELTDAEYQHLFIPFGQSSNQFGGQTLGDEASASQVADNIIEFVAKKF